MTSLTQTLNDCIELVPLSLAEMRRLQVRASELESRNAELEVNNADLQERVRRASVENDFLRGELQYRDALAANPSLNSSTKMTLTYARKLYYNLRAYDSEPMEIHLDNLSELTGLSTDTLRRELQRLAAEDVVQYDAKREYMGRDKDGKAKWHTHAWLAIRPKAESPGDIEMLNEHGGKRVKKCRICLSENLTTETDYTCADCNSKNIIKDTVTSCVDCGTEAESSRKFLLDNDDSDTADGDIQNDFQAENVETLTVGSCEDLDPITEPALPVVAAKSPLATLARLADWDEGHGPKPSGACWDCGTKNVYHWNYLNQQWACGWCHALTGRGAISS